MPGSEKCLNAVYKSCIYYLFWYAVVYLLDPKTTTTCPTNLLKQVQHKQVTGETLMASHAADRRTQLL